MVGVSPGGPRKLLEDIEMSKKEEHEHPEPSKPVKRRPMPVRMGKQWSALMRDMALLDADIQQGTDLVLHRVTKDGLEVAGEEE